jgi:AhpD family alkylhydroperoxidase
MSDLFPRATRETGEARHKLAPEINDAWDAFSKAAFAEGAIDVVTKQLIAVAVAHTTQCPYCITGHTKLAARKGATPEQIMEAIWVAAEMRAGGAYAHSTIALEALGVVEHATSPDGHPGHQHA